jgi:hypothetical protein
MQGEQLLQDPQFAGLLSKSPFKPQDLPGLSSTIASAYEKMPPEVRKNLKEATDNLNRMPLPNLKAISQILDSITKHRDRYPEVVAQLVKSGTFEQGDLPARYDPRLMAVIKSLVGQAIVKKMSGQANPGYAKGGIVSLKDAAEKVKSAGRDGDTMLAHINPAEAAMLKQAGGSGTINPETGLPEFGFFSGLKDLFKVGAQVLGTAVLSYYVGPAAAGAIVGGVSSLVSGGSPADAMKNALIGGAMGGLAGGISNVASGGSFWEGATNGGSLLGKSPYENFVSKGLADTSTGNTLFANNPANTANMASAEAASQLPNSNPTELVPTLNGEGSAPLPPARPTDFSPTIPAASPTATENLTKWASDNKWPLLGAGALGLYALNQADKSSNKVTPISVDQSVTGRTLVDANPSKYRFDFSKYPGKDFSAAPVPVVAPGNYIKTDLPQNEGPKFYDYNAIRYPNLFSYETPQYAKSGILNAAVGGAIDGPGTGTSDSIPARLSDGEFVMTAKAVRGAGNGDRKAGAENLYKLMHKFERRA